MVWHWAICMQTYSSTTALRPNSFRQNALPKKIGSITRKNALEGKTDSTSANRLCLFFVTY